MNKKYTSALCGLVMAFGISSAYASEDNAPYNTSNTDSVTIGTSNVNGGAAPGDAAQVQAIQQGAQDLKSTWSGDAQRQAVEQGR